jgi:hypothetical protein
MRAWSVSEQVSHWTAGRFSDGCLGGGAGGRVSESWYLGSPGGPRVRCSVTQPREAPLAHQTIVWRMTGRASAQVMATATPYDGVSLGPHHMPPMP